MELIQAPYKYKAEVVRWIDGDSVVLNVDLGFKIRHEAAYRLVGIDTPERGEDGWGLAKDYVEAHCPAGSKVLIESQPPRDKYGRYLVHIVYSVPTGQAVLNWDLVDHGLAVPYDGGKK